MDVSLIYLHMSNDVVQFRSRNNAPLYFSNMKYHVGQDFIFSHKEIDVTQGDATHPHRSVGIDFDSHIGGSGSNGGIEIVKFCNQVNLLWKRITENASEDHIFAIVDHNSAHHMSYALAWKAFETHSADKIKLIISFDHHSDYTAKWGQYSTKITCSNWAGCALHFGFPKAYKIAEAVAHFGLTNTKAGVGPSGNFSGTKVYKYKGPSVNVGAGNPGNINLQTTMVLQEARRAAHAAANTPVDVYVTVDRDFMKGSWTPYKDGNHTPAVGRQAVQACLTTLQNAGCRLVGFDVTGLPNGTGYSESMGGQKKGAAVRRSNEDIRVCYRAVLAY